MRRYSLVSFRKRQWLAAPAIGKNRRASFINKKKKARTVCGIFRSLREPTNVGLRFHSRRRPSIWLTPWADRGTKNKIKQNFFFFMFLFGDSECKLVLSPHILGIYSVIRPPISSKLERKRRNKVLPTSSEVHLSGNLYMNNRSRYLSSRYSHKRFFLSSFFFSLSTDECFLTRRPSTVKLSWSVSAAAVSGQLCRLWRNVSRLWLLYCLSGHYIVVFLLFFFLPVCISFLFCHFGIAV